MIPQVFAEEVAAALPSDEKSESAPPETKSQSETTPKQGNSSSQNKPSASVEATDLPSIYPIDDHEKNKKWKEALQRLKTRIPRMSSLLSRLFHFATLDAAGQRNLLLDDSGLGLVMFCRAMGFQKNIHELDLDCRGDIAVTS